MNRSFTRLDTVGINNGHVLSAIQQANLPNIQLVKWSDHAVSDYTWLVTALPLATGAQLSKLTTRLLKYV